MHVAVAVGAPKGYLDYLAIDGARFCVEMALRSFGGPPAGFWVFQRKPVRIPVPGPEEMARWADEWFARDDPVDSLRGEGRGNAAERLVKKNKAFGPGGSLSPRRWRRSSRRRVTWPAIRSPSSC